MGRAHAGDNSWKGKELKGSISQRGEESWSIRLDAGRDLRGKRRRLIETVHGTREDALSRLAQLNTDLEEARVTVSSGMRVKKYFEHWLETDGRMGINAKTYERYKEITEKHLIPAFGHLRLSQLDAGHIQIYIHDALKEGRLDGKGGLNPRTVVHHVSVLQRALQDAVNNRQLPYNPAVGVKKPKPEPAEIHIYTPQEMQQILTTAKGWPRPLHMPILLDYATGMREGELLSLTWKHVDLDRGSLSVLQTLRETKTEVGLGKRPKTKSGQRQVAISPTIVDALRRHRAEQSKNKLALGPAYEDQDLLFPNEDGIFWKPGLFSNSFANLRKSLGLGGTFHDVRHTHATELLKMGVHPKIVSERLGHASVQITLDTYSHVLPDMQRAVAVQLDDALVAIQRDAGLETLL